MTAEFPAGSPAIAARRWHTWLVAAGLFTVIHLLWLLAGLPRTTGRRLYGTAALAVLYYVAAGAFYWAARRTDLPARLRTALRLVGVGLGMIGAGATYLTIDNLFRPAAFFSVADWLFLSFYPLTLTALAILPRGERPAAGLGRILLDGAVFVVGVGVPLWVFAIQPNLPHATGEDAVLTVLWPVVAFIGVMAVNAALLTRTPLPSRPAFWLLLAALGVSWLADLVFTLDAAARVIMRAPINWINVANTVSVGLALLAAGRFAADPMPDPRSPPRPAAFSPVPLLTIVVVSGWLVLTLTVRPPPIALDRVVPSMILLFAILFVRETLVMRDSLRWIAAEAQREGQARFEAMVRHSSDVIMIVDPAGRIRFASPAATAALGLTPEALVDRTLTELVHPQEAARGADFLARLAAEPEGAVRVRWRLRHAAGGYRHFETAGSNLRHEAAIGGLVLNLRDITEQVALEQRLTNAQKMEAVGRMAGGVAHDFNNLLAIVMANAELALMGLPARDAARVDLDEILRAARRGATLTGRLLLLSQRDRQPADAVAPAEILRLLTPALERTAGANLAVAIRSEPGVGSVRVPAAELEQLLTNLTTNARDAAPGGTLTLAVRSAVLREPLASPHLSAGPGRYVVIEATDTGSGMDESTRARLFEPFFTTKPRGQGKGLGLASIYGTVKAAGGGITVRTESGRGTTFAIWLPETGPEEAPPAPAAVPAPVTGASETILLVEDELPVREVTARSLQTMGYRVLSAVDADDAEKVLAAHPGPVHLLLTDVIMPGRSGPALAADLVRQRPDLRVLFMSGYTGDELEAQGLGGATTRLLVKPFSLEQLGARLRQVLAGPAGL